MRRNVKAFRLVITATAGLMLSNAALSAAENPSSPAEQAATAKLNNAISSANVAADSRYDTVNAQFQKQKKENEALIAQYGANTEMLARHYDDLRTNYAALEMQYEQLQKQNDDLRQKIGDLTVQYGQLLGDK